jgi:hypothetical protein
MLRPIHLYLVRNIQISPLHALNSPMQTALPPSSPISRPPLLHIPILILIPELRHLRPPPQARQHNFIIRRQRIQHTQLSRRKHPRQYLPPQQYQCNTKHRKPNRRYRLGDRNRRQHSQTLPEEVEADPRGTYGEERAARLDEAGSRSSQTSLCSMSFVSMEPQPTTKKTPTKMERGMMDRTTRRGPVIVPMMARPMKK